MFKKILLTVAAFVFSVSAVLAPVSGFAATIQDNGSVSTAVDAKTVDQTTIVETITNIANGLIVVVVAISVIFIVYGAFLWMTKGQAEGQKMVVNAVIGLIIAVIAFFIVQLAVGAGGFLKTSV